MVEIGQVIAYKFPYSGKEELYFRTKETRQIYGATYYTFCKVKNPEELSISDFWSMSERFFNEKLANGSIRLVNRFCDI